MNLTKEEIQNKADKFEQDFRDWLNNEINHYNIFDKVLSSEDEIKWLKQRFIKELSELLTNQTNK